jgi:hypothetical protein
MIEHDFNASFEGERRDIWNPKLWDGLRKLFPTATAKRIAREAGDKSGTDVAIVLAKPDQLVRIDFKFRSEERDPGTDILLEFQHRRDDGSVSLGWVVKPTTSDLFANVFKYDWSCWLLPTQRLQQVWKQNQRVWLKEYGVKSARNSSWWSDNCPVPCGVLLTEVAGIHVWDGEKVLGYRFDNPYCCCGALGQYVVHEALAPSGRVLWFCEKHRQF